MIFRKKKSKRKHGKIENYFYVPLSFEVEDNDNQRTGFESQEYFDKKIQKIVKEMPVGTRSAMMDVGLNEFFTLLVVEKTHKGNPRFYNNPKMNVVPLKIDNDDIIYQNTYFMMEVEKVWNEIKDIKNKKSAVSTFDRRTDLRENFKKNPKKLAWVINRLPHWKAMEEDEQTFKKNLHKQHFAVCRLYQELRKYKRESITTLWEDWQWINLTEAVKKILKGKAMEDEIPKGGTLDYTGKCFGSIIKVMEDGLIINQKNDFRKKIASKLVDFLIKHKVQNLFLENLRTFNQEARRKKSQNKLLQMWGHRALFEEIKKACEMASIKVYDYVDPRYLSQHHPCSASSEWTYRMDGDECKIILPGKNTPQLMTNKYCVDADGRAHDTDKLACHNMAIHVFQDKPKPFFIDCYIFSDNLSIMCNKKDGKVYVELKQGVWHPEKNGKISTEELEELKKKKTPIVRLFLHGKNWLEYNEHISEIRSIGNRFQASLNGFATLSDLMT